MTGNFKWVSSMNDADFLYGGERFTLTSADIERLKNGEILNFSVNEEYGCTLKYEEDAGMTDKEAIRILEQMRAQIPKYDSKWSAITTAIGAIGRDHKVDDITFHWNDDKNNFLAACNAFEDILRVYNRGVTND